MLQGGSSSFPRERGRGRKEGEGGKYIYFPPSQQLTGVYIASVGRDPDEESKKNHRFFFLTHSSDRKAVSSRKKINNCENTGYSWSRI